MSEMNRIVVIGSSGSGKTTFARKIAAILDLPHLEMDAVFHKYGFADEAHDEFLPTLKDFTSGDRWVVDGNYTSHGTGEVVWPRADTIIWLDPPRGLAMSRVVRRTLRRVILREELWPGVKEPFSNLYSLDPYQNIMVWTWTRHHQVREKYETAMTEGSWDHVTVRRLRSAGEVRAFLDSITSTE